ncbi:radical SAM protein [bacterium]|nr:radical SAM protein [bacterium]
MNLLMAYPAKEEFALSSIGFMWLCKIAEETNEINVTRISTDTDIVRNNNIDAIAFSMSFDFDYLGMLEILDKLNIPFYKSDRGEKYPLIFAGGPVITTNPRPYEDFLDFMIIGDGEGNFRNILNIINNNNKESALNKLKDIEGVYFAGRKTKKVTEKLERVIYSPIVNNNSYFKNTFIIETARGCMNRCAFCTASYTNLPFRNYDYEKIIESIDLGLSKTNKIALLGAQISAHPKFNNIMKYIRDKIESGNNIQLGISSLRADSVTPEMVQTLVLGGQKNSTIAIEAASERLRKFINKNITEKQILNAVKISRENGLKGLKVYSMIGIPSETQKDIDEFIRLGKKIKSENKGFNIEFSFSTFVPKPNTPFQWAKRENTKSLESKQKYLEKELSKIGIKSKFSSPKWDFWQTVLSRADKNITPLLVYVYKNGGKIGAYKSGIKELNIDINKTIDGYDFTEELPWDCIEIEPRKELLIKEYNRLLKFVNE